jgi:hypothetical protein
MKTVSTPQGDVKLLAPTFELLAAIKLFPPLGVASWTMLRSVGIAEVSHLPMIHKAG